MDAQDFGRLRLVVAGRSQNLADVIFLQFSQAHKEIAAKIPVAGRNVRMLRISATPGSRLPPCSLGNLFHHEQTFLAQRNQFWSGVTEQKSADGLSRAGSSISARNSQPVADFVTNTVVESAVVLLYKALRRYGKCQGLS